MQLPRGTFREIKKHTKFGVLFAELQQTRFSGICTLSFGKINGILVFKSGKRILAEYENHIGDAAWDELQKIGEETVDAALSTLNAPQIELSLEFNKSCRILNVGKGEHSPPSTIPTSTNVQKSLLQPVKPEEGPAVKNNLIPAVSESTVANRSVHSGNSPAKVTSKKAGQTSSAKTSHKYSAVVSPPSKGYPERPEKKESIKEEKSSLAETKSLDFDKEIETFKGMDTEAISNFDRDIDTFETMDLEAITNKIRIECKDIIKQLNLDHLKES
jgi:hypothetical protein